MRQPPLIELSTALAWLLAVSVVGALVVALAAAETKRPSQNTSRAPGTPWSSSRRWGCSWLTSPGGSISSSPPACYWRRWRVFRKNGSRGISTNRQPEYPIGPGPGSFPASVRRRRSCEAALRRPQPCEPGGCGYTTIAPDTATGH